MKDALLIIAMLFVAAPSRPVVMRPGQSLPIVCLNGMMRIEPGSSRQITITCGNVAPSPTPAPTEK